MVNFRKSFERNRTWGIWRRNLIVIKAITSELSDGRAPLPGKITLPNNFGEAWLHLVLGFTAIYAEAYDTVHEELNSCYLLLSKGRKDLKESLFPGTLQDKEAVLPLGIVSLLAKAVLRDTRNLTGLPDICKTYDEYISTLVSHPDQFLISDWTRLAC